MIDLEKVGELPKQGRFATPAHAGYNAYIAGPEIFIEINRPFRTRFIITERFLLV
jgi:hypothetical protein